MWIRSSDALSENVFQLVTAVSSHHLLIGECSALIDAGVTATTDSLIKEIEAILGEDCTLEFVLLTHAHFDHCGGIPALRARFPELEVFASPATAQLLADQSAVSTIYEKNKTCAAALGQELPYTLEDFKEQIKADRIMGDGDVLDIGADVEIKMISAPGHSEDFVAFYTKPDCALFAGEAAGQYNGRDQIHLAFTQDYHAYLESLDRLSTLDIKLLGFSHSGTLTGELIGKYFVAARAQAERFRELVRERVAQGELQEEILAGLLADWQTQNICPEGPFVAEQEATLRSMIRAAARGEEQAQAEE